MNRAELRRLAMYLLENPGMASELKKRLATGDHAARWVSERGYDVTEDELRDLLEVDRELSDDELEQAAGGDWGTGTSGSGGGG